MDMRAYKIKQRGMPEGQERSKLIDLEHAKLTWLNDQLKEIFDRFEPYLGFARHR